MSVRNDFPESKTVDFSESDILDYYEFLENDGADAIFEVKQKYGVKGDF